MTASANVKVLETALKAIPYPHQISNVDVHSSPDVLRFTWRGNRFRVDERMHCEEVVGDCLSGSDLAILMQRVLQLTSCALDNDRMVLPA